MSNSSVTEEDIAPFNSIATILVQPMANLTVMFYVYGIYTVLFIISLHILIHQQDRPNRVLYMFFTIALFTLTSAYIIVTTFVYAQQATLGFTFTKNQDWASFLAYLEHDNAKTIMDGFAFILPPCLVTMADLMLLHRCYVIWGSSKWIAFPFIFMVVSLAISDTVASAFIIIGVSNTADPAKYQLYLLGCTIDTAFWLAEMGINIALTLLTASRIWWISREARKHMGSAIKTKYNMIIAIILESGILYPTFLTTAIIYTLLLDPGAQGSSPFSFFVITYQVAGIAPTLIIIRAAGGKTVEHTSMNQVMSSLQFADGAVAGSGNSDPRSHIQTIDIEGGLSAERIQNPGKEMSA
uniref:G protein-coupled receptor n=1 Tax=Moniliophthora roreri TaxID=221103 RepID=A0A0W0GAL5_MONRR